MSRDGAPTMLGWRRLLVGAGVGIAVGLAAVVGLASSGVSPDDRGVTPVRVNAADATWPPGARPAPDFVLLDQTDHRTALSALRGRVVLLTFLDSHCKTMCPIEGRLLEHVQRRFPADSRPVIAVVSVNPNDSPASARSVANEWGWRDDAWRWFMGSERRLSAVWRAYGIDVVPTADDVRHTAALYVIDPAGDQRAGFAAPFDVGRVMEVVRTLTEEAS